MAISAPARQAILAVAALVAAVQLLSMLLRGSPLHDSLYRHAGGQQCPGPLTKGQRSSWEAAAGEKLAALEQTDKLEMWPIAWPEKASAVVAAAWKQRKRPKRLQPKPGQPYATSQPELPPEFREVASARSPAV